MSVNNIPGSNPALVRPSDFLPTPAKPSDFQAPPKTQEAPVGLQTRASTDTGMAPRASIGQQFGLVPPSSGGPDGPNKPGPRNETSNSILANGGKESTTQAKEDAKTSMDNLREINEINMKFQMDMAQLQMVKGFVEAQAKAIKDIGTKIAQAAS